MAMYGYLPVYLYEYVPVYFYGYLPGDICGLDLNIYRLEPREFMTELKAPSAERCLACRGTIGPL